MSRLKFVDSHAAIPATIHVGDVVTITATARVVEVSESVIDVSALGQPTQFVPRERTYTLNLVESKIE